ncbi:UNVERIFIED_CONTAM: hypothetical protein GTU68_029571 [Idotea baltica]|nr:hypothetical protein [Idotea baltica]
MQEYQHEFIQFSIDADVLRFGEFKLKSGRLSPYFFNSGLFNTGNQLAKLGQYYADAIVSSGIEFDVLFGPAYKGIPLVSAVAIALNEKHGIDKPWVFNRKEAKTHGEGGFLVGAELNGRVLIIDDVITAGTAIRESIEMIDAVKSASLAAVCVSIDRQEKGQHELSAIQEIEQDNKVKVVTIAQLSTVIEFLSEQAEHADTVSAIEQYRAQYGSS